MNNSTWQRTFVLIKPDGVLRGLAGTIIHRFEQAGLKLRALKMETPDEALAREHYQTHKDKPFFEPLITLLTSGPVVIMALEGAEAIGVVRKLVGATEPKEAAPGTIRGDFSHMGYPRSKERQGVIPNLIHASDSPQSAAVELGLWFQEKDMVPPYDRTMEPFL